MWHCSIQNIRSRAGPSGIQSVDTESKKPDSDVDNWNPGMPASSAPPPVFLITNIRLSQVYKYLIMTLSSSRVQIGRAHV